MKVSEFATMIKSDNAATMIKQYFDEIMVLYDIIGHREDIFISTGNNLNNTTEFKLELNSEKSARELFNRLNGVTFSAYNDQYLITMTNQGKRIIATIDKQ